MRPMNSVPRIGAGCVAVLILCLAGCGAGDGLVDISGAVTYSGRPIQRGAITLIPSDGNGPTAAAAIVDGRYFLKVCPGAKRVEIAGYRVTGRRRYAESDPASPMVDAVVPIVPERYNAKSELACVITRDTMVRDFALQSDNKPKSSR
jgi:hypothetical protein